MGETVGKGEIKTNKNNVEKKYVINISGSDVPAGTVEALLDAFKQIAKDSYGITLVWQKL